MGELKVYFNIQKPTGRMISEAGGTPYPEYESLIQPESTTGIDLVVEGDKEHDFALN